MLVENRTAPRWLAQCTWPTRRLARPGLTLTVTKRPRLACSLRRPSHCSSTTVREMRRRLGRSAFAGQPERCLPTIQHCYALLLEFEFFVAPISNLPPRRDRSSSACVLAARVEIVLTFPAPRSAPAPLEFEEAVLAGSHVCRSPSDSPCCR